MRNLLIMIALLIGVATQAADTTYLKVHFLYGSKPMKEYQDTENKWFGGVLGGHVGIEGRDNKVLNFLPQGSFHIFKKQNERHSTYAEHDTVSFYKILGGDPDSMKKAIVYIPVSPQQKQQFDSIAAAYLEATPYDYALVGMRCGSATYEILGQLGILKQYGPKKTAKKIFYPKKLRKRLLKKAQENNWTVTRQEGTTRRKWETD